MYPRRLPWKPSVLLIGLLLLAGCGGGGGKPKQPALRVVAARGAQVAVPSDWQLARTPTTLSAAPAKGSDELVSVSLFRLLRPYTAALWPRVVPELDAAARELAGELEATVAASRTVTVAGGNARQYDLSFTHAGRPLSERITFVLNGRSEYQLLCRWSKQEPAACGSLVSSFAYRTP